MTYQIEKLQILKFLRRAHATGRQIQSTRLPRFPLEKRQCAHRTAGVGVFRNESLKSVYPGITAMAERVRKPRGIMAEPAHVYEFRSDDLGEDLA